ncbi:polysaccharide deacetylase family protein [Natrinema salaciae]|uniref:Peptidoglycan/xylan/chitin deacetylase, PgdA/CDA1 family n=1 Tax=Natrinema salaciae TaxID=1186196 RepID=A0A1H9M0S8_9EURY|nr:polysaccharide deacetylase family protein [Natrinema salaciae]SER17272.1 Peptidoglycan/xylan/chitin deacetylase, PgdA/CDA1 family [Natrinema salaciae]
MHRRRYLAVASSLCLAGCSASRNADSPAGSDSNSTGNSASPPVGEPDDPTPTDEPSPLRTLDDFESLDSWESFSGTLSADANRAVVGTQSAKLEVPAGERTGGITTTFAEPRDFSDVVPGLAVATDELVVPWLRLVDDDGNEIDYRRAVKGGLPFERYNFGVDAIEPKFDSGAVREVHILVWSGEEARTVWLDDLHLVPRPETGKVMFQFDDAHVTDYTTALPLLEEYDYPAVTFVNPGRIEAQTRGADDPGGFPRLTVEQVHELHDAGWVVGNHCHSHPRLPELDAAGQEREISEGKAWLEAEGFDEGARYFAYPFGEYDERTLELVDEYHDLAFAGGRPVQGYAVNPRQTSRIGEPSAEQVQTAIERTAAMRGITSLFFHQLEGEFLTAFEAALETVRTHEAAGDLDVILPGDLENEYLAHT